MTRALPGVEGLRQLTLSGARGIQFDFKPSPAIIAGGIDKLGLDIRSFREPLTRAVKEVMIPSIKTNFAVGGRPAWEPLSDNTLKRKKTNQILVETGALKRVMGQQNIWTITPDYAVIQDLPEKVWYGKVHQGGATFGKASAGRPAKAMRIVGTNKRNARTAAIKDAPTGGSGVIPARPFVVLQASDQRSIESIFRHWLQERIDRAYGRL